MSKPLPLVSIIVPCYNQAKYVARLLDSVLEQSYKKIELITINDGATDNTLDILESYRPVFKKRNIRYKIISQENGGLPNAINAGLKVFAGDYINFIDCDDYFSVADSIEKRVNFLESNRNIDVVWAASNIVDATTGDIIDVWGEPHNPSRKNLFMDMILQKDYVWVSASKMVRASTFLSLNPERFIQDRINNAVYQGQNIQIFLPLYYKGNNVGYINEALVNITAHHDSESRKHRNEQELRKYHLAIRNMFLDTLHKINMPEEEREKCMATVREMYKLKVSRIFYRSSNDKDELEQLYDYDEQKFRKSYVSDIGTANQNQLAAKLVFSAHSLEKSLSNDNFEIGHGLRTAQLLVDILKTYKSKNYDQDHLAYTSTLSVLSAFYKRHKETKFAEEIDSILDTMLPEIENCKSTIGGSDEVFFKDKKDNDKKNFKELAEGRFAVRSYSDEPVSKKDIEEAIAIAMKTPTVCNRQSLRVHVMYKKEVIEKVLEVQGGIAYYDTPPVLLLITADDNGYVGVNERNQGFVDGGLFAMSVLYALEYKKLAACPCHAMFTEIPEKTIRGMLDLADSEKLITFISVGHFNEKNSVCKSFRYPVDYILSEKDEIHDFIIEETEPTDGLQIENNDTLFIKIRRKLRLRTRMKNALRRVKHATRIRTRVRQLIGRIRSSRERQKYKNVDGAILTLTGYFNYGNIIQRFALQEFLRQQGRMFVSYWHPPLGTEDSDSYRLRNTTEFVEEHIVRKSFDPKDNFPTYIVGSDQVWRNWSYESETTELGYYFLDFTKNLKTKRIAYAASIGQDTVRDALISKEFVEYAKPLVKKFDAISMRESSGVESLQDTWGVKAQQVLDPTMLLTADDYNRLIQDSLYKLNPIKPVFCYILIVNDEKTKVIERIAHDIKKEVDKFYLDQLKVLPPVEQWLKGFRDAELVITDSFHGMVFSIINNTPFVVLESGPGGVSRITSLLHQLGLEDRFITANEANTFDMTMLKPIDWERVNKKLIELRAASSSWLLNALKTEV